MLADFHTKPSQGALFRLFRDVILGLRLMSDIKHKNPSGKQPLLSPSKERVEKNDVGLTIRK